MCFPFLLLFLGLFTSRVMGQIVYSGFIDKYPIELVVLDHSDKVTTAIYVYKNFDTPIKLTGSKIDNKLTLYEKDTRDINTTSLTFDHFDEQQEALTGTWVDLKTGKQLSIQLHRKFEDDHGENVSWNDRELLQAASLKDHYFKLLLSKNKDAFSARITGVKIMQKKTDKLIQQIELDCQLMGVNSISTGDFNFDGIQEFAVFEASYAGPNTSSLYFLYDPITKQYVESGFTGVSLTFDGSSKTIVEHNQCCAGTQHTTALYKVVKNKMVLKEQHCFIWDEKKQELVERKMKYCQ